MADNKDQKPYMTIAMIGDGKSSKVTLRESIEREYKRKQLSQPSLIDYIDISQELKRCMKKVDKQLNDFEKEPIEPQMD